MRNVADIRKDDMGACSRYRLFLMADIWRKSYTEEKRSFFEVHFSMKVDHSCGESRTTDECEAFGGCARTYASDGHIWTHGMG